MSLDAGLAGLTDIAGVDAPSVVVRVSAGFVMAYVGSDGTTARVHLATSHEGHRWEPSGSVEIPGGRETVGGPCLVEIAGRLWLFYTSPGNSDRMTVFGATSSHGTAWRDAGPVLEPDASEHGVSEPWVVVRDENLLMLFVRDGVDGGSSIGLATSSDGRAWSRRPEPLDLARRHHDAGAIGGPSALSMGGQHLRVWYAAENEGDTAGDCRLWTADVIGALS